MADDTFHVEFQLQNPPLQHVTFCGDILQEDVGGGKETNFRERRPDFGLTEEDDCWPLLLLADVALAPHRGEDVALLAAREMENSVQSMQLQLQFFMHKANDLHSCLLIGKPEVDRQALAAAVQSLLYTCQPYFNYLESTTRSTGPQHCLLPLEIYLRLLEFSQQLCERLEQLVLTFASYNLLCVDDTKPNSVSPFCIGQSQLGHLRLTMFRYCMPMPYLAQVNTGLYKRMRWNVEKLQDEQWIDDEPDGENRERKAETEYYFLCYEDIPNTNTKTDGGPNFNLVRMWSIGLWVQLSPDPYRENIYDWISCEVPQGSYHKLLFLGSAEPSSSSATNYLHELLLSQLNRD